VNTAQGAFALRLLRAEQRGSWSQELRAMRVAVAAGIPVPTIHQTLLWQERPVILMSWCAGEPVAAWLLRQPWRVWRLGQAMGRMQAQIHRIVLPPDWPPPPDPWVDFADPHDPAIKESLLALPPRQPTLLHLDFHPLNLLSDGKQITAVLD
jgi:Ser/Thr protein kinase RdoA (MazF antagonist)